MIYSRRENAMRSFWALLCVDVDLRESGSHCLPIGTSFCLFEIKRVTKAGWLCFESVLPSVTMELKDQVAQMFTTWERSAVRMIKAWGL